MERAAERRAFFVGGCGGLRDVRARSRRVERQRASSTPMPMPAPWWGEAACAASPAMQMRSWE